MSETGQDYISGTWRNGHTNVENINLSYIGDLIGYYVQADLVELDTALDAAGITQRKSASTGLEALHFVNDTHFRLTSAIITRSSEYAVHFRRNANTGVVTNNFPSASIDYHVPFGERRNTLYGTREQGGYTEEFYTIVKTSYIAVGNPE